jgi:hypothetical protein
VLRNCGHRSTPSNPNFRSEPEKSGGATGRMLLMHISGIFAGGNSPNFRVSGMKTRHYSPLRYLTHRPRYLAGYSPFGPEQR